MHQVFVVVVVVAAGVVAVVVAVVVVVVFLILSSVADHERHSLGHTVTVAEALVWGQRVWWYAESLLSYCPSQLWGGGGGGEDFF